MRLQTNLKPKGTTVYVANQQSLLKEISEDDMSIITCLNISLNISLRKFFSHGQKARLSSTQHSTSSPKTANTGFVQISSVFPSPRGPTWEHHLKWWQKFPPAETRYRH